MNTCKICHKKHYAKGLCSVCYQKEWKKDRIIPVLICPRCNKTCSYILKEKNICQLCNSKDFYIENKQKVLERTRKYGKEKTRKKKGLPLDHPRLLAKAGEGHTDKQGYKVITKVGHPNATPYKKSINKKGLVTYHGGRLGEHTFIMSEHIGRPLRKKESVHHKNGIRDDNRLENLELWHKGQPAGQRLEEKLKWAKDFLEEYGYRVNSGDD